MPAGPELAGAAVDYYRRNRTFLAAFEPAREESFFTQEGQRSLLTEEARLAEEDRSYRFYLALREAPDGGLLRRGYMTEAVEEAVRIAFTVLGLHRIEANIMPRNTASLGVARKAGFQEEGLAVRYLRINGVWEDHIHMVRRDE